MSGSIEIINTDLSTPFVGAVMDDMVVRTALPNQRIHFASGSNLLPVMTLSNSCIGVNTLTPQAMFHVAGNALFTGSMTIGTQLNLNGISLLRRTVAGSYNITQSPDGFSKANGVITVNAGAGCNSFFVTGSSSNMVLSGTGNLGVGTLVPLQPVDVVGNINASSTLMTNGVGRIYSDGGLSNVRISVGSVVAGTLNPLWGGTGATGVTGSGCNVLMTGATLSNATLTGTVTASNINASNLQVGGSSISTLYAPASHTHNASAITSGTISTAVLPVASTGGSGIVQLMDSVASASTSMAATANSVKAANDNANTRFPTSGGTLSGALLMGANNLGIAYNNGILPAVYHDNKGYIGCIYYDNQDGILFKCGGTSAGNIYNHMIISSDGTLRIRGSLSSAQNLGDYAEYFEWSDGNPNNQDRIGYTVTVCSDGKVKIASQDDDRQRVIGVVSGISSIVSNSAWDTWNGLEMRDEYGRLIYDAVEHIEWVDLDGITQSKPVDQLPASFVFPETYTTKTVQVSRKNPNYNSDRDYVSRANRKEWVAIGLLGRVVLRRDQVTGPNWIKICDFSATTELWLIR